MLYPGVREINRMPIAIPTDQNAAINMSSCCFQRKLIQPINTAAISAAISYDMTTLVIEAIENGASTSDEIKDYLMGIEDYEGYSNTINFNANGMVEVQNGIIKRID